MEIDVENREHGVGISFPSIGFDGRSELFSLGDDEIGYRAEVEGRGVVGE